MQGDKWGDDAAAAPVDGNKNPKPVFSYLEKKNEFTLPPVNLPPANLPILLPTAPRPPKPRETAPVLTILAARATGKPKTTRYGLGVARFSSVRPQWSPFGPRQGCKI